MTKQDSSSESLPMWNEPLPEVEKFDIAGFRKTEEGKALTAWLSKNYSACKSARESEERQWKYNLAMYGGKQYVDIMRAGEFRGELAMRPNLSKKERLTINRLEAVVRTEMARLVSQKPSASCLPASADDEDLFAAMAAEQVWESQSKRRGYQAVFTDAAFWMCITGNGIIKSYWDDSALDGDAKTEGDIIYENVTPFNLLVPDVRQTDIERQPFLIHVYTKSLEWLHMYYEEELKDLPHGEKLVANANAANEILEDTYLNISGGASKPDPDQVIVQEFWIKPGATKMFPNGGYAVLAGDILVAYEANGLPYNHQEYPFAHFHHIPSGKFYRRSVLNSLNALQVEYNSTRSQISDARKKMGKPQIVSQQGAIASTRWNNETGLNIQYKPGYPEPKPFPLQDLPSYIVQSQERITLDIEDISGQHQVSKGNAPPGVTAATAISFLQERDDSYLVPTYQSIEAASEKVARQTLSLVVQMWDVPRMIKVVGEDGSFDTLLLAGADIESGTDIRIEPGSALPTSKAARQAFIMDLMTNGFVTPEEGLEMLEVGGAQKLMDHLRNDKRQAQRENVRMKRLDENEIMTHSMEWVANSGDPSQIDPENGQSLEIPPPVVTVNSWDNHQVHIEVHNRYRRSQAFEFLSDTVKAQFEAHVEMHKQYMHQEMLQKMLAGIPGDGTEEGAAPEEMEALGGGEGMIPQQDPGLGSDGAMPEEIPSSEEAVM